MSEENFNRLVSSEMQGNSPLYSTTIRSIRWAQNEIAQLRQKLKAQEDKSKNNEWEYYQKLLADNGFDGITDILVKYQYLESVIREAREQKPAGHVIAHVNGDGESIIDCILPKGSKLYTSPMPAQQSPVAISKTENTTQSPAVAVPEGVSVITGVLENGCRIDFETVDGLFSDSCDGVLPAREYLYTSPPTRITEQDAREIALRFVRYWDSTLKDDDDAYIVGALNGWFENQAEGLDLLNKLNAEIK